MPAAPQEHSLDPRAAFAGTFHINEGYARLQQAHTDAAAGVVPELIDPRDGALTVRLDPLPTRRATAAVAQLCEHLTATGTRYPGTDLILRYEVRTRS